MQESLFFNMMYGLLYEHRLLALSWLTKLGHFWQQDLVAKAVVQVVDKPVECQEGKKILAKVS